MIQLNLGCGTTKLSGFINIDVDPSVNPDISFDIKSARYPYEDNEVDQVILFHTIEHIEKKYHLDIFKEIRRILKPRGTFLLSYPEFERCAMNWIENARGKRDFWEATIYGRQSRPDDFHVAAMRTSDVVHMLYQVGFDPIIHKSEPFPENHNTVVKAIKSDNRMVTYEEVLAKELFGLK